MSQWWRDLRETPKRIKRLIEMGLVTRRHVTETVRKVRHQSSLQQNKALYQPHQEDDPLPRQLMNTGAVYIGDDTMLARNAFGQKMFLPSRDVSVAPHLMMDGLWEEDVTRAMLRLLKPGMRCLDLGANTGYYTLLFAKAVGAAGRVEAFEANGFLANLVNRSIVVNGYKHFAVCHAKAVASKTGTITFTTLSNQMGSGSIGAPPPMQSLGEEALTEEVPAVRLDDQYPDPDFDFIKIDCEGAEADIIAGGKGVLTAKPQMHLFFEYLPSKESKMDSLFAPLAEMGYSFHLYDIQGHLTQTSAREILDRNQWAEVYARRG